MLPPGQSLFCARYDVSQSINRVRLWWADIYFKLSWFRTYEHKTWAREKFNWWGLPPNNWFFWVDYGFCCLIVRLLQFMRDGIAINWLPLMLFILICSYFGRKVCFRTLKNILRLARITLISTQKNSYYYSSQKFWKHPNFKIFKKIELTLVTN